MGNGDAKKSQKQISTKKSRPPKLKKRILSSIELWPVFHLCAILCFSLAFGLLMMHLCIIWQNHMYGDTPAFPQWPDARSAIDAAFRERIIAKYGIENYYALYFDGHLKVNTSLFVR